MGKMQQNPYSIGKMQQINCNIEKKQSLQQKQQKQCNTIHATRRSEKQKRVSDNPPDSF